MITAEISMEISSEVRTGRVADLTRVPALRFGPYRAVEWIAAGGMGAIYRAVHVATGAAAAVKVLPPEFAADPERRERFALEAAVLCHVRHPNVRRLLLMGEGLGEHAAATPWPGGGCFLVMEWLPCVLADMLQALPAQRLAPARALAIAHAVAEGLGAVHAAGIVHRDVKPSNILLRDDGSPVLSDFGLAGLLTAMPSGHRLTPTNVIVGTAEYLAPEQVLGGPVDARTDLYSLGVVLYEMLAGRVPFEGRTPVRTLYAHVQEAPARLAGIPSAARCVVERALQKHPARRFSSAGEMAAALAGARADLAAHAGQAAHAQPLSRAAEPLNTIRGWCAHFTAVRRRGARTGGHDRHAAAGAAERLVSADA